MSHTTSMTLKVTLMGVAAAAVFSFGLNATVPAGWYMAGSKPAEYEAGVDASAVYNDHSKCLPEIKKPRCRRLRYADAGFQR